MEHLLLSVRRLLRGLADGGLRSMGDPGPQECQSIHTAEGATRKRRDSEILNQ